MYDDIDPNDAKPEHLPAASYVAGGSSLDTESEYQAASDEAFEELVHGPEDRDDDVDPRFVPSEAAVNDNG